MENWTINHWYIKEKEEIKELIIQSLETKGLLGKISVNLRNALFIVVNEKDQQFNTGCGLKWEKKILY